jgi:hypothetical protein
MRPLAILQDQDKADIRRVPKAIRMVEIIAVDVVDAPRCHLPALD